MTATEILSELDRRGVELQAAGERLRFRPKDAVPPKLLEAMKQQRAKILEVLQSGQPVTGYGRCPGPEKCAGCYSIGVVDVRERFLHPPKVSQSWLDWLTEWQLKGDERLQ